MRSFALLLSEVINIYIWLLIASAILSWLIAFNVVNTYNRFVAMASDILFRLTDPPLRPIRSFVPSFGGIDVSPIILILLLSFARNLIFEYLV